MAKTKAPIQHPEQKINSILYRLSVFVTGIAVLMMLVGFFSRGQFPPTKISIFYITVLLVYSLHKEALRWISQHEQKRKRNGEYFVYGWVILTTILYLLNFLTKDYFYYTSSGQPSASLSEITITAIEVCGVFIVTRLLKMAAIHFKQK